MANINYTATADLKAYSTWLQNNTDQNASTWDSTTQEGVLVLNSGVTMIGPSAFNGCTSLLTIDLPNEITTIGQRAFKGCTGLTTFKIPENVTSIDMEAFQNCSNLIQLQWSATNVTSYSAPTIQFSGTPLENLIINDNVTTIPGSLMSGVSTLRSVYIGRNINVIPTSMFQNCSLLTSITIPSNVTTINSSAFSYCTGLTSVTCEATTPPTLGTNNFPASNDTLYVPSASLSAYQNDSSWSSVFTNIEAIPSKIIFTCTTVPNSSTYTTWVNTNTDTTKNTIVQSGDTYTVTLYVNNNVTEIIDTIFYQTTIKTLIFDTPNITQISVYDTGSGRQNYGICANCVNLTSVILPENLTILGNSSFYGCSSLTNISLPTYLQKIGPWACLNSSITTCNLGANVQEIANNAFTRSILTSITIDSNNQYLNDGNGSNCVIKTSNNTLIFGCNYTTLPQSVTHIGSFAFEDCAGLTNIDLSNIISLNQSTFRGCTGLTSIDLSSLTAFGFATFQNCTGLTNVILNNNLTLLTAYIFSGCTSLVNINLPTNLISTEHQVFDGCSSLYDFTIPESVTSLGANVFKNTGYWNSQSDGIVYKDGCCLGYKGVVPTGEITIQNNTRLISNESFQNCNGITLVTLPESITTIGQYAFNGCTGLTKVTLPTSLTHVGYNTFKGCTNLLSVTCKATTPPSLGSNNFPASDDTLYVPSTSKSTYENTSSWRNAFTNIKGIYTVTTSAGDNGTITPTTEVLEGESFTVTATPNAHYKVSHFIVDGIDVGTIDNYTFQNLDADHTIYVEFELITHTITSTAFEGGAIVPSGAITVTDGENQSFDIIPLEGYGILAVFIDGTQIEPVETYTFTDVEADHTIDAMFYTLQTAGFNRDEMLDIDYIIQDYLEQLKKRD